MDPKDDQIYLDKVGRGGWNVIGREPDTDPVSTVDENNRTVTTQKPNGNIKWVITDGKGHNQTMTVAGSIPAANADSVVKPPADLPKDSATATPASGLERLDAGGKAIPAGDTTTKVVYLRDPAAPAGSTPFKVEGDLTTDPSKWTPIQNPNKPEEVIGLWDPVNNKVGASVSAPSGAKDSDPSKWTPVYRTPGDPSSGIVGQYDPVNHSLSSVSALPDKTQVVTTPNAIYVVDAATGKSTKVQDVDPKSPFQSVVIGNQVYKFDPKDGSYTAGPVVHPDIKDASGNPMVWNEDAAGNGKYGYPPGVSPAATINNSTTLKNLEWYDNQGNLVASRPNSNYVATQTTQGAASTTAPQIQQWNPKTGAWEWVENKGRVVASQALHDMAQTLSGQVVKGDISQDEAVQIINAANSKMTNDINQQNADTSKATQIATAAGDVLRNASSNAQTGANLLQNRVTSATGALQNILGTIGSSKITSIPSDFGSNLVGGLSSWVTGLGGGQAVYDTATRMVQAADPKISGDPTLAQQATQTLAGMLAQYQKQTGEVHPLVAATQAANQSVQGGGGVTAPVTTPDTTSGLQQGQQTNVSVNQALQQQQQANALRARGLQNTPQGAAITTGQTPVATHAAGLPRPVQHRLAAGVHQSRRHAIGWTECRERLCCAADFRSKEQAWLTTQRE